MTLTKLIGDQVWVIAEIGINHEGSIDRCIKLIDIAYHAGVNAIKLQTIDANLSYAKDTESYKIFSGAELSLEETELIFNYAKTKNLTPFSTIGDIKTLHQFKHLNPSCYKISSGLLNCDPFLVEVAKLKKPIIMSNGMGSMDTLKKAIDIVKNLGSEMFAVLHCVSQYPPVLSEFNFSQIRAIKDRFSCITGYSDHSGDPKFAPLAVLAGAKIIEVHVTEDKRRVSYDHKISLDSNELKSMVDKIRFMEKLLGSTDLNRSTAIQNVEREMSRYIASSKPMRKGEKVTLENVTFMRFNFSNNLMEASKFNSIVGRPLCRDIAAFQPLSEEDF